MRTSPDPGLILLDLDAALNVPDVLPPGTVWTRLDQGSSKLWPPDGDAWVWVTSNAEGFDEHTKSHAFLLPGRSFFECLATPEVPTPVYSLDDLLDRPRRLSTAGRFDVSDHPPSTLAVSRPGTTRSSS